MTMYSYQTIVKYDDCSRKYRARNLDDIRSKQRLDLERIRFRFKNLKMIQNRSRSLLEDLLASDSESDYTASSPAMDEPDFISYQGDSRAQDNEMTPTSPGSSPAAWGVQAQSGWDNFMCSQQQQQQCDELPSSQRLSPSPAWSSSASSSSTSGTAVTPALMCDLLPSCLFDLPEDVQVKTKSPSSTATASKESSDCSDEAKLLRRLNYKQCNKRHSPRSKSIRDIERIRSHLVTLRNSISMCNRDAVAVSQVVRNHWQVVLDAIQVYDKDIVTDALNILISVTANNLVVPETVLHMLQHGLITSLADTIGRTAEGPLTAVRLLHNIARSTPNSIPYMIDFVHRSRLLEDFVDFIGSGFADEAQTIIEFYHLITETTMNQIYQKAPFQPLIPDILLLTGVSQETVESFGPIATLTKCLAPNLIKSSITKCSARTNLINNDLIDMTFRILANILKLIHIISASQGEQSKHNQWIVKTLCCFRDSQIESHLASMAKGLERIIHSSESSEHCSQGVGANTSAMATLDKCRQFMTFYQQYYGGLSNLFANPMKQVQPESPAKINSWCL